MLKATRELRKSQFDQETTSSVLAVNAKSLEGKVDLHTFEKEMGTKGTKLEQEMLLK